MKKRKNNGIFYVVISLLAVLGIGGILYAYTVSNNVNVEGDYNYYEAEGQLVDEIELGGTIGSDIYHDVIFHGETQLADAKANITIPVSIQPTTTATVLRNVGGLYENIDDAMLCENPRYYQWDDIGGFAINMGVGTTTNKDGDYLTATTSRTIMPAFAIGTSSEDFGWDLYGGINTTTDAKGDAFGNGTYYEGTGKASSTPFLFAKNDIIVIDFDLEGATSTQSFTNGEGATDRTIGAFYLDCIDAGDDLD